MDAQVRRLVVVADDDDAIRLLCRVNLELDGYDVEEAASSRELVRLTGDRDVALVLLDVHLGAEDGVEVARALRERHPDVRIAFLSGSVDFGARAKEVSDAALPKPFSLDQLSETVRRLAGPSPPPPIPPPATP